MKKQRAALLLTAAMVLSMTACGNQTDAVTSAALASAASSDAGVQENVSEAASAQNEDVLAQMDAANADLDSILAEYGSMLLQYQYVQSDVESTIYLTSDTFLEIDSDGYIIVDDGTQIYGRDSEAEEDYFKLADFDIQVDDTLTKSYESVPWYTSELLDNSAVVTTADDGTVVVTLTEAAADEDKAEIAEMYETSVDEIQGFEYHLELDPETMLIKRFVYSLDCGSMGILITEFTVEYGSNQPEIPEELNDFLNETDVRKVTVITNPGTDDETTFEDTIRKGCYYKVVAEKYNMYTDAACTQLYEGGADYNADFTIYLKLKDA